MFSVRLLLHHSFYLPNTRTIIRTCIQLIFFLFFFFFVGSLNACTSNRTRVQALSTLTLTQKPHAPPVSRPTSTPTNHFHTPPPKQPASTSCYPNRKPQTARFNASFRLQFKKKKISRLTSTSHTTCYQKMPKRRVYTRCLGPGKFYFIYLFNFHSQHHLRRSTSRHLNIDRLR